MQVQLRIKSVLAREVESALFVSTEELNLDSVANVANVFNLFCALVVKLGDVNHTFLLGSELNERTDRDDSCNNTFVDCAYFGLEDDTFDYLLSSLDGSLFDTGNEYGTVVFDVNLSTCFSYIFLLRYIYIFKDKILKFIIAIRIPERSYFLYWTITSSK